MDPVKSHGPMLAPREPTVEANLRESSVRPSLVDIESPPRSAFWLAPCRWSRKRETKMDVRLGGMTETCQIVYPIEGEEEAQSETYGSVKIVTTLMLSEVAFEA